MEISSSQIVTVSKARQHVVGGGKCRERLGAGRRTLRGAKGVLFENLRFCSERYGDVMDGLFSYD